MHLPAEGVRAALLRGLRAVVAFAREAKDDRLPGLAAETAFFAVLSVFPGLLVAGSLLGLLEHVVGPEVTEQARQQVLQGLGLVLTDRASGVQQAVRSLFDDQRSSLLTLATAGALVTLSGAFAVVVGAINIAHDVQETRPWWRRRLLGLVMAVATLVLVAVALAVLVVGPLFGRGEQLADVVGLGPTSSFLWDHLRLPAMGLVLVGWAAALLRFAPNDRLPWRGALPGALLTGVLWLVASAGFRVYVGYAAARNPVLGAFGGGVIALTWVYLLSLSLLLGGELNAELHQARSRRSRGEQLALFPVDATRRSTWARLLQPQGGPPRP